MNDDRRKALSAIRSRIEEAQATITSIKEDLDALKDEEREYHDNMPESFQQGERGQKADEAATNLEQAVEKLETLDNDLTEAIGDIENAEA
jgi:uncharacterized coiled-coil DUF342 family protein